MKDLLFVGVIKFRCNTIAADYEIDRKIGPPWNVEDACEE